MPNKFHAEHFIKIIGATINRFMDRFCDIVNASRFSLELILSLVFNSRLHSMLDFNRTLNAHEEKRLCVWLSHVSG